MTWWPHKVVWDGLKLLNWIIQIAIIVKWNSAQTMTSGSLNLRWKALLGHLKKGQGENTHQPSLQPHQVIHLELLQPLCHQWKMIVIAVLADDKGLRKQSSKEKQGIDPMVHYCPHWGLLRRRRVARRRGTSERAGEDERLRAAKDSQYSQKN